MLNSQISNFLHIIVLLFCILAKVSINSRTKAKFSLKKNHNFGITLALLVGEPEVQKLEKSGRKVAEF